MSKLQFQYDLQNLTPANAQPVEANFTRVEQHVNQEVVERDGTVAMRAQLKLVGDPVAALDAAPKQYVDQVLPIGLVMMYGALTPPANGRWLSCDGSAVQTATYPELFGVIGYAFGGSGGSFNLPDLRDRFPFGTGPGGNTALAARAGSADTTLPAHSHTIDHGHSASAGSESVAHTHNDDHYHSQLGGSALSDGNHSHHTTSDPAVNVLGAHAGGISLAGGAGGPDIDYYADTTTNGAHTHSIAGNTNYKSQTPGQGTNTGTESAAHSHAITVNGMSGASGQTGVAPAGTNMPPYVALAFIIRCK